MNKKIKFLAFFIFSLLLLVSLASYARALDVGTNEVASEIQLSSDDPRRIVARVINITMMFLGAIAVGLIIFAGFKWMSSGGNEEKIEEAKKVLKGAVIGLLIILSSWGIASFILSRLIGDTGSFMGPGGSKGYGFGGGFGAVGACTVDSLYPEPEQKDVPRNTSIIVSFKEEIKLDTVCVDASDNPCACDNTTACNLINKDHIIIYETDKGDDSATNITNVVVNVTPDNKTFVLVPQTPLGSPSNNIWHTVYLSNDIAKANGTGIFSTCSTDYMSWQFEVSNKLDLTPPVIEEGAVFPAPDDAADTSSITSSLAPAVGSVTVVSAPQAYVPASVTDVNKNPVAGNWNDANATIDPNYHGDDTDFSVTVIVGNKAKLSMGSVPVMAVDWNGNKATFPGYFELEVLGDGSYSAGNSWLVTINPEVTADTLTIGGDTYTFVSTPSSGFNIQKYSNPTAQANTIAVALSGRLDVTPTVVSNKVTLTAKVQGTSGNSIALGTNAPTKLSIVPMSGGANEVETVTVVDKKDKPMNSTIQITFNEAINPMTVSGNASEVYNTIRVVNAAANAMTDGDLCAEDSDCASYKCENSTCVGDYIDGKFSLSNGYRTLEFSSNKECGMNGCGDKIYCLPGGSNLRVEIVSADLLPCSSNSDCSVRSPYITCASSSLPYQTCKDNDNYNYPGSYLASGYGLMDSCFNSLNGNRDDNADGPISYYDENVGNDSDKDSYRWSFFISNKIEATPPKIVSILPAINSGASNMSQPIIVSFDKLIMNSTLRTGSLITGQGTSTVEHKLFNLRTSSQVSPGYWLVNDNEDINPVDNEPDSTKTEIRHSMFSEGSSYSVQIGSGVKDIYQNCFKPSSGLTCEATQDNPSCCNGVPGATLDAEGNCAFY